MFGENESTIDRITAIQRIRPAKTALVAYTVVNFLVNHALVCIVISLDTRARPWDVFTANYRSVLLPALALFPIGVLLAAMRGCEEVQLIASPVNSSLIAFHRQLGFEVIDGGGFSCGIAVCPDFAGLGHGATFRFVIPQAPSPAAAYAPQT